MSGAASDSCLRRLELAMTLRDCTIFLRIPAAAGSDGGEGEGEVEAKLGDLDLKNSEAKLGYWMELERDLAEQGFYAGTESPRQTTNCWLERHL